MEKYIKILKDAKEKNELINIHTFLKKCKDEDGIEAPTILKEIVKNGLGDILTLK